MRYQRFIWRLLFSVIGGAGVLIPVQAFGALQTCTFHDTGMVNLPAQITVPTNTPLGTVIATGEADIDFTCVEKVLMVGFAKLGRCGDLNTRSFDCSSVSIQNMKDNAMFRPIEAMTSNIFYSPYMGVGIRMRVKYVDTNARGTASGGMRDGFPVGPRTTHHKASPNEDRFWSHGIPGIVGVAPATAGNVYWKGKLLVELVKIENKWPSQKAFDDYSMVSYQDFVKGRPNTYDPAFSSIRAGGIINQRGTAVIGLGYSGWDTRANLNREEFLSHAVYLSFIGNNDTPNGLNPFTSRVYRLGTRIVEPITCTVTTPVVNVDMGNVSIDQLDKGIAPERTFNVGINCPGGARVQMAFADNSEPSNTSNTLTVSKNSEAAGIGLQLRKDSTPIIYNSSNSNMLLVAELANAGFVNVPLVAKVVKTGPVKVGRYTAQSTITLGYQ